MKKDIFREEAVSNYYEEDLSGVLDVESLTSKYILLAFSLFAVITAAFFCFIPLGSTLVCRGLIFPSNGYSPVVSPSNGYMNSLDYKSGSILNKNQKIFSLKSSDYVPLSSLELSKMLDEKSKLDSDLDLLDDIYVELLAEFDKEIFYYNTVVGLHDEKGEKKRSFSNDKDIVNQSHLLNLLSRRLNAVSKFHVSKEGILSKLKDINLQINMAHNKGSVIEFYSPVSGEFQSYDKKVGQYVKQGEHIGRVVISGSYKQTIVFVREKDIGSIKVGQKLKIFFDSLPWRKYGIYEGVVKNIPLAPLLKSKGFQATSIDSGRYYHVVVDMTSDELTNSYDELDRIKFDMAFRVKIELEGSTFFSRIIKPLFSRQKDLLLDN